MTAGPLEPREPADRGPAPPEDDLSIVPGLGAAPEQPGPSGRLDPALDPDRYDPSADEAAARRLDPALDPDRFRPPPATTPPGQGQTLTELLGDGAHEEERDNYQWAYGLLGVLAFLALVAWLFSSVLSP